MALSEIKIEDKKVKLDGKVNVCPTCLKFLALQGAGKDTFVLRLDPSDLSTVVKCDVCGNEEAEFVLSPFERGIKVCEKCLEVRGKKHNWMRYKVVKNSKDMTCDLCLSKGAKLLKKSKKQRDDE